MRGGLVSLVCSVVALGALAGCGDDAPEPGAASSSAPASGSSTAAPASPSTSAPASASAPGSASGSASGASSAGPAATGTELTLDGASIRLPAEWDTSPPQVSADQVTVSADNLTWFVALSKSPVLSGDLDELAKSYRDNILHTQKQEILDDATFDGATWFHLAGQVEPVTWAEDYGTILGDQFFVVSVEANDPATRKQREAAVAAIMASVQLSP